MAVTNEQISEYLAANPSLSDAEIAAAMAQHSVTPEQMAQVTGLGQDVVQARYDAATAPLSQIANTPGMGAQGIGLNLSGQSLAPDYGALTSTSGMTVEDLYQSYAGRGSDPGGLQYWAQQFGDTIDPNEIAVFQSAVAEARAQGTEPAAQPAAQPVYFQQNPDVAAAYQANSYGMTPDQFAASHFQNYGANEQRTAPTENYFGGPDTSVAATTPTYDYEQMVRDAYGSIGRTGMGDAASNIDQAGFDGFVNALRTGAINPQDFDTTFKGAVADYLVANPDDQYSTYVTNYLQQNNAPEIAGIRQLYQDVLGRDADPSGLGTFYKQFGSEISPEERALFEQSARPELRSRVENLYRDMLGRDADQEGIDYWAKQFGSDITEDEREQFRQSAAAELIGTFGGEAPDDAGLLAGFKRAKDLGISNDVLKSTLGEDLFNTYEQGLTDFAVSNLTDIVADNQLTWTEAQRIHNFGRDLGFTPEELAEMTGQDKSIFELADTNYRTGRDQIIGGTLSGATDVDRVISAVALQKEFGFTDEEIAEATGYDVGLVKSSLDPVRNFESEFTGLFQNTDTTTAGAKSFLESARSNPAISKLYGDSLNEVETNIRNLEEKWSSYGTDALQAETLSRQLKAQRDALGGQYYKGIFGDLEKSAALLVNKGLDTINDLGQKDKFQPTMAEARYTTTDGVPVQNWGGKFVAYQGDGEYGNYVDVPADQVKTTYGRIEYTGDGENYQSEFIPLNETELATLSNDGTYQKKIGTVVIDKDTGKELTGLDGNLLYQRSGGHATGKKHYLTANFTPEGVPILTTSQEKTGLYGFVSDVAPMALAIASFIPGPHQPFARLANAALALEQKNYIGAVLSGLSAAGSFTGNELATLQAAEASGDIVNASRMLELKDTLSNIKLAQTFAQGAAALQAENIPGLINSGISAYAQLGDSALPSGLTTAVQLGNLGIALNNKQYDVALNSLGDLTGSNDYKIAGAAATLVDAIQKAGETGDFSGVVSAGLGLADVIKAGPSTKPDEGGITNRVVDDAVSTVSTDTAGVDAFTAAKNAGATDEEAMEAANAVTGVVINKIPESESGNVVTTTYDSSAADNEFGNLQGAIETNAMDDAVRADELNVISNLPKFADAYSQARTLLGPNQTFTWNGKEYSTATAAERPDLSSPKVEAATDESAAETARLNRLNTELVTGNAPNQSAAETTRLTNLNAGLKSMEKTGFLERIYKDLNEQFRLQGVAANEYLANNPDSPITNNISTAFEAAGNLQKNVAGGVALLLDDKPLADALVAGGNKLTQLGQSIGTGPQDTKNWEDTVDLVSKANGFEKVAVIAGRILDGTSGLGRQVEIELRQELPGMFLGGGSVKGILLATGAMDTAETAGNAALDAYDEEIKKGASHEEALSSARTAGAVAGMTEAAVQLTLGKVADVVVGKIGNVAGKAGTKIAGEGIVEGGQEAGSSVAVDLALGNAIDVNKALTQGVLGAAVGKGAATATSGVDAAQTDASTSGATTGATATDLGSVGATAPGAESVTGSDLGSIGSVTPSGDAVVGGASTLGDVGATTISVADAEQAMADLGLNVSGDAAVSLATKIQEATNSGNDVSVTSGANTVTIADATTNTDTTFDISTGVTTSVDNANNVTTVVDGNTSTVVDANANTTSQTTVDTNNNTQTTVTVDANTNTNTQTTVNNNTNITTSVTVDANSTTQTTIDANNNTQTTVLTNTDTNTQTTVKVNTDTGDVIEVTETEVPTDWKPPVIEAPVVPGVTEEAKKPAIPKLPSLKGSAEQRGGGGFGLPSGINVDPASLRSKVTGGAIDPIARVKQAQAELEREVMMNQLDPRFAAVIQQRTNPQQQAQQYDKDIGALAKLLSGEPSAPANEGKYYSYGSEDSIDSILGGMAANYKEGGFVEPLKASGGMVLPLLAKSGGALGKYSGREDFKDGKHVAGDGDGQSDGIPAWLADGEFVFPADVVSALGNGSTKAGTDKLYEMMHGIRDRARSKGPKDLPPPAFKSPLDYLKSSKRSK